MMKAKAALVSVGIVRDMVVGNLFENSTSLQSSSLIYCIISYFTMHSFSYYHAITFSVNLLQVVAKIMENFLAVQLILICTMLGVSLIGSQDCHLRFKIGLYFVVFKSDVLVATKIFTWYSNHFHFHTGCLSCLSASWIFLFRMHALKGILTRGLLI